MRVRVKALRNLTVTNRQQIEGATYKEDASGNLYIPQGVEFVAEWDDHTQYILTTINAVQIISEVVDEKPKKAGKVVEDADSE